ncbi:aldo/keto reductase [Gordoniibacillus kamchatkensis]|uniref:Aldo/keto reductase n=1 Tax=Gordoniibacillus kamchatkensis TaxID=1590651 RepID=A0ABR5AIL0_9BACL|nr:aldo/keto reductase [Paenibacillus sp. VKM B-2647]KIL40889.1 aldo/keto reductase [Paenibacillus sp. VKM B-2647]
MQKRKLGTTGIEVSPVGFGCWAIGGPFWLDGLPDGWGEVDDRESIRAIGRALELGINFFDTSDAYGAGHSEEIIGQALKGRRHETVIATKFGFPHDAQTRQVYARYDLSPEYIRQACEASLRRLATDYIDLYQIHVGHMPVEQLDSVIESLERLKEQGLIRAYGWSTADTDRAEAFAERSSGAAIQHDLNVLSDNKEMIELCERRGLSSINNTPLAMGLLSGKFNRESTLPSDDVRGSKHEWVIYFKDGKPCAEYLDALHSVKEILTSGQRSLVQGALGWIWGRSGCTIPIPGLKTVKQVEEAAQAMSFGPLAPEQMKEIEGILRRR